MRINAQDEAELKVIITGSGNLPVINAPQIRWPAGVNAFDPTAKEDINKTVVPMSGSKTFDYVFTPGAAGHYTIPPVSFSFFDPSARAYKTVHSVALEIQVSPAAKKKIPAALAAGVAAASTDRLEGVKAFVQRHLEAIFAIFILSGLAFYLWRQNLRLRKSSPASTSSASPSSSSSPFCRE